VIPPSVWLHIFGDQIFRNVSGEALKSSLLGKRLDDNLVAEQLMCLAIEICERMIVENGHGHAPKTASRSGLYRKSVGGPAAGSSNGSLYAAISVRAARSTFSRFRAAICANSGPCSMNRVASYRSANSRNCRRISSADSGTPSAISSVSRHLSSESTSSEAGTTTSGGEPGVDVAGDAVFKFRAAAIRARHCTSRELRLPAASATATANS